MNQVDEAILLSTSFETLAIVTEDIDILTGIITVQIPKLFFLKKSERGKLITLTIVVFVCRNSIITFIVFPYVKYQDHLAM